MRILRTGRFIRSGSFHFAAGVWKRGVQILISAGHAAIALGGVGLTGRSRRPYRHANQLPVKVQTVIVRVKREHPSCTN